MTLIVTGHDGRQFVYANGTWGEVLYPPAGLDLYGTLITDDGQLLSLVPTKA